MGYEEQIHLLINEISFELQMEIISKLMIFAVLLCQLSIDPHNDQLPVGTTA